MTSENPYSPPRAESERPIRELPAVRLASLFFFAAVAGHRSRDRGSLFY